MRHTNCTVHTVVDRIAAAIVAHNQNWYQDQLHLGRLAVLPKLAAS